MGANVLHDALASLAPTNTSALPSENELGPFLIDAFKHASFIVDSIPQLPVPSEAAQSRSRSNTASSDPPVLVASAARSGPPAADRAALQKEWKEVKPGGVNSYEIKVYKLSSKDGNGAWFARRSVHQGIGYRKFRKGLRREFEEGLKARDELELKKVNGEVDESTLRPDGIMLKPGVRGIGAERNLDRKVVKGVGRMDVYHLSAQFPGPTTPRDFVTLCLTTAAAHPPHSTTSTNTKTPVPPREFTMVSRPFDHPDLPVPQGFVRGRYESVEFIREILPDSLDPPSRAASMTNLEKSTGLDGASEVTGRKRASTTGQHSLKFDGGRQQGKSVTYEKGKAPGSRLKTSTSAAELQDSSTPDGDAQSGETRKNIAGSDDAEHDDDDDDDHEYDERESNPVEWIMLTRSDPGGSVPRFMVERGTPGGIIADAEKFLKWALNKEHHDDPSDDEHEADDDDEESRGPAVMVQGPDDESFTLSQTDGTTDTITEEDDDDDDADSASMMSFRTATSGKLSSDEGNSQQESLPQSDGATSFVPTTPIRPGHNRTDSSITLQRLADEESKLHDRLAKQRQADLERNSKELEKEDERKRKIEEKHARDAAKREAKYKREQEKAEEKRKLEEKKLAERKRKLEEKDEKLRWAREKEGLQEENKLLKRQRDALQIELEAARRHVDELKLAAVNGADLTPRSSNEKMAAASTPSVRSGRSGTTDSVTSSGSNGTFKKAFVNLKDKIMDTDQTDGGLESRPATANV